jgi:hypothetical protein
VAGANDALLRLLEEALKVIPGPSLPDLFLSSWLAMLVSRIPGKIERRCSAMIAILDDIVQEHQDRRSAGGVDEDEDLLDVLLRLQRRTWILWTLTTDNIKAVISVSTATRGLSPNHHRLHSSLVQRHLLSQDLFSAGRDVGNDTAAGDGRDDAEPVSFVEGAGRGPEGTR